MWGVTAAGRAVGPGGAIHNSDRMGPPVDRTQALMQQRFTADRASRSVRTEGVSMLSCNDYNDCRGYRVAELLRCVI